MPLMAGTRRAFLLASVAVIAAGPMTDPLVTGVRSDGWSADYTAPPTFDPVGSPKYIVVDRQGFDATGAAATIREAIPITQRVRQAYSAGHSTSDSDYTNAGVVSNPWLDSSRVALARYIYASDTIVGGASPANNSTVAAPKPIAQWITQDGKVIGNSLVVEVCAMHIGARLGEEVPCVEFSASDGSTTLTQKVSASAVSGGAYDISGCAIISYKATFNTTTLTDGATVTVNAKVYPWIGKNTDSSAIADSSGGSSTARDFGPLTFRKMVSLAANPLCAYVSTTGNNGTAVISQTAATALASPFATITAAQDALQASTAGGKLTRQLDGCEIRLMAGTHTDGAPTFYSERSVCALTIKAAPGESASTVTLTTGTARDHLVGRLRFENIKVTRSAFVYFCIGNTRTYFVNCILDGNSQGVQIMGAGAVYIEGGSIINEPYALGASTNMKFSMRAVTMTGLNSVGIDSWSVIGCALTNPLLNNNGADASGSLIMFNNLIGGGGSGPMVNITGGSSGSLATYTGVGVGQNAVEWKSGTSAMAIRLGGDGEFANFTHACLHHNTVAGFYTYGRCNNFYNETSGSNARTHTLISEIGNIWPQKNTKHDVFAAIVNGATGRTQSWAYMYGVENHGNLTRYADANSTQNGLGSYFSQAYGGLRGTNGAATTGAGVDPLFTSYAGTTTAGGAGAGGGTYSLQSGSPAEGMVTATAFNSDLSGAARSILATAAGAYKGALE